MRESDWSSDVCSSDLSSYEHEKELRAIVVKLPEPKQRGLDFSQETIVNGISIHVDITLLIENVYVAPDAPNWLTNLIESVIHTYGFNFPLIPSPLLNAKPEY
jgi:hypothetical protein